MIVKFEEEDEFMNLFRKITILDIYQLYQSIQSNPDRVLIDPRYPM